VTGDRPAGAPWIAGADAVPLLRSGDDPSASRRLHAVGDAGLVAGRALCLAPVRLLDPAVWRWPEDGDEQWPLCWTCLALTHLEGHDPWRT
jgi:hypothetical protein